MTASPPEVEPGQEAELHVTLTQPGDQWVEVGWTATGGAFPQESIGEWIRWGAPESTCVCTLTVTVRDRCWSASADITIPVVANRPLLEFGPESIDFGAQTTPSEMWIGNGGGRTLGWELHAKPDWIDLSRTSGLVRAGEWPDTLVVEARRENLPAGAYQDTVALTSNGGTAALPVSMRILPTPVWSYVIVDSFPHDREAFTQGLAMVDGELYEGTGRYGKSLLRKVELETGAVLREEPLPRIYFGEGIAIVDSLIFQLTLNAHRAYVYRKSNFEVVRTESYPTVGWGLTYDGERIILSAGNSWLYFHDVETFDSMGRIEVRDQGTPVDDLNELEFIDGLVWANILYTDRIACIDPDKGEVVRWLDLAGLSEWADYGDPINALNGIAYDSAQDRLYVTGKYWPVLFEIELVPPE